MIKYILILFFVSTSLFYSQDVSTRLEQISMKLEYDMDYLNLKYISFTLNDIDKSLLQPIPRFGKKDFNFSEREGISYQLLFLDEGIGIDKRYLLQFSEITKPITPSKGVLDESEYTVDTVVVVSFENLWVLRRDHSISYNKLLQLLDNYILINGKASVGKTLKIKPNNKNLTVLGFASRNSSDYLNYKKATSPHWFPKKNKKVKKTTFSRGNLTNNSKLRFHLALSKFTFSYGKIMDFSDRAGASLEVNTHENIINQLPYQANTINSLVRIIIASQTNTLKDSFYFTTALGYRIAYDNSSITDIIQKISGAPSKLNFSNSFYLKFNLTRPFNLPFLTIEGSFDEKNNTTKLFHINSNNKYYLTLEQFQFYTSFYWNASDKLTNRFRIDIGLGYHDVIEVDSNVVFSGKTLYDEVQPILALHYIFASQEKTLFGISSRFYNYRIKFESWFNLASFGQNNIQFKAYYLSQPIMRELNGWESESSLFVDIAWRYGL